MKLTELASFDVVRDQLAWPWLAFDPCGTRFAFADSPRRIASRTLGEAGIVDGPSFSLPGGVDPKAVRGFAIHPEGAARDLRRAHERRCPRDLRGVRRAATHVV